MHAAEQSAADSLLNAFKTIDAAAKSRHASVLDYWLSIRGDREFPPLHDLDPLAISDAGPCSALLELIGGGEDAEIRHLGETLKMDIPVERIIDAPSPSILSSIAKKLSIVAISRNFLAFEDQFLTADTVTRCWVTLLPLSSAGAWVDYVYAFVTFESVAAEAIVEGEPEMPPETTEVPEYAANDAEEATEAAPVDVPEAADAIDPVEPESEEAVEAVEQEAEPAQAADEPAPPEPAEAETEPAETAAPAESGPGFSDVLQTSTNADGFYGAQIVKRAPARSAATPPAPAPESPAESPAEQPVAQPAAASSEPLQAKLDAVRAKADAARMAKLASNAALYEGLSAAYDFALDAEESAEEYLKIVEAQGLKIQLRSPMKPVMKLAFAGKCDDATIARLEAVLAWALEQELPRGSLAAQIEAAGGIARILNGEAPAS
jgi:hypothetical protein